MLVKGSVSTIQSHCDLICQCHWLVRVLVLCTVVILGLFLFPHACSPSTVNWWHHLYVFCIEFKWKDLSMLCSSFLVIRWMRFSSLPMLSLISSSMCWNDTPWCKCPATDSLVFSDNCTCVPSHLYVCNVFYISLLIFVPCVLIFCCLNKSCAVRV